MFLGYNRLSRIDSFHSNARNTWDDDDPSFFSQKDSFIEFCPILLDLKFKKKDSERYRKLQKSTERYRKVQKGT